MAFQEKPGKDSLMCKGIPDGHCVDKSFETNDQMLDSLSQLRATSNMNPDKDGNFNIFQRNNQDCTKKPVSKSNCWRKKKKKKAQNVLRLNYFWRCVRRICAYMLANKPR